LRYIISLYGITVDLEKIEAIKGWSVPKNVMKVRSFIGLISYYQIFKRGFSNISSPVTSLQKKGVKFEWTSKCEESFQLLKDILTSVFAPNSSLGEQIKSAYMPSWDLLGMTAVR
jgi:hypothetical protein